MDKQHRACRLYRYVQNYETALYFPGLVIANNTYFIASTDG